ncbi:MAG: transporter permease, partial [Polaromonas sp.]|nr:transporter permease [Polaromonas sp.]
MEPTWTALLLSLKVAGLATAINLVLGIAVGFALARLRFPGRDLLDTLLTLPMVMPPTVLGYYLL